ncbi:hypothetical protein [Methylocystis echinoides]|uniref:PRC-barrel domain-containing protein n=1 Tax=Methylocystis echinoides TaxID=29468 RepID=A0A9W6GS09_9HYPH|nr:hypothetical protein [Methylocystis echinoides]GLI92037.1 hypothetical protein LMG27198_10290 [Methylocystis echinoides]
MRPILILIATVAHMSVAGAATDVASVEQPNRPEVATVDYTDASGRLIGSVTKIGGVTYFAGPDGVPLGVAETVNGKRVFRRY